MRFFVNLIILHLVWGSQTLVVENESYPGFFHRRSVLFVGNKFFVILDEAIGNVTGSVEIHFQLEPGQFVCDLGKKLAYSDSDSGGNILVKGNLSDDSAMLLEEGWISEAINRKVARPAFCFRHEGSRPCCFITLLVPYKDRRAPEARIIRTNEYIPGMSIFECTVEFDGQTYEIVRKI